MTESFTSGIVNQARFGYLKTEANTIGNPASHSIDALGLKGIEKWQPGRTVRAIDTTLAISLDVIMRLVFSVEDVKLMQEGRQVLSALRKTIHPLIVFLPDRSGQQLEA